MKSKNLFLVLLFTFVFSGCGAWWQRFRDNPIEALTNGTGYLMTAVSLAETAFATYAAANPVDAQTRSQFHAIVGEVKNGIAVAQSGLAVAADLHQNELDTEALMRDAKNAVNALANFLAGLPHPNGSAVDPTLANAITHCRRAAH
jgi:hypothetical protein